MEYRMNHFVQVRFPECTHTLRQIPGYDGIFDTIGMYSQSHQFVSEQEEIERKGK